MKKYKSTIILIFLLSYIFVPISIFFLSEEKIFTSLVYSALTFLLLIFISEFIFNILNRNFFNEKLKFDKNFKKDNIYFHSHPYLPFEMKKNMPFTNKIKAEYNKQKFDYFYPSLSSNNFGFANGPDGSREVKIPKDKDTYRINCLGGSTTGNYLEHKNNVYSYPLILEQLIKEKTTIKKIEVNNFGQGGYNSSEVLINFLFKVLHTNPDMVILYLGYNDIRSYLTKDFEYDYSHSRKNIDLSNLGFFLNDYLPNIRLNFYRYLLQKVSIRNSLLNVVSRGELDINQSPNRGLQVFKNNIENIIAICKAKNITLILSSFCKNENKISSENLVGQKFLDIVNLENKAIKELSIKYNCEFVDNESLVEKNDKNFVDSIHFTHFGMEELSKNFFDKIKTYLTN